MIPIKKKLNRMKINQIYHYDGIIIGRCINCGKELCSDISITTNNITLGIKQCPWCKHKYILLKELL